MRKQEQGVEKLSPKDVGEVNFGHSDEASFELLGEVDGAFLRLLKLLRWGSTVNLVSAVLHLLEFAQFGKLHDLSHEHQY